MVRGGTLTIPGNSRYPKYRWLQTVSFTMLSCFFSFFLSFFVSCNKSILTQLKPIYKYATAIKTHHDYAVNSLCIACNWFKSVDCRDILYSSLSFPTSWNLLDGTPGWGAGEDLFVLSESAAANILFNIICNWLQNLERTSELRFLKESEIVSPDM